MGAQQNDLFEQAPGAGSLACAIEIAAAMSAAIDEARQRGLSREDIANRMSYHLGERLSVAMLNAYTAPSRDTHEINLRRAMAFDAAIERDVLLQIFAGKRGNRRVISQEEAIYIELGKIHQQERELAERKRTLQAMHKLKLGGVK